MKSFLGYLCAVGAMVFTAWSTIWLTIRYAPKSPESRQYVIQYDEHGKLLWTKLPEIKGMKYVDWGSEKLLQIERCFSRPNARRRFSVRHMSNRARLRNLDNARPV